MLRRIVCQVKAYESLDFEAVGRVPEKNRTPLEAGCNNSLPSKFVRTAFM